MKLLLSLLLKLALIRLGSCAVVLQCGEACLQDVAQYTCTVDATLLTWTLPDGSSIQITQSETNVSDLENGILFTAVLTGFSNNQITSTLSFMTTIPLNNAQIRCSGENCNVNISGKPSVPLNISIIAIGPNTVVVSWSPPLHSSQCIDHYVVSIVNGNEKNTSNSTTTLVINQLIQGMDYSFSVTGVDNVGRTGGESETTRITFDVPESVIDLNCTLTNKPLLLIITWKPPSDSLRPPVIDYHVYHNITSSDGSLVHNVTNNMTRITFTNVSRGSQYIVNVTAENIIGIGEVSLIHVFIPISSTTMLSFASPSVTTIILTDVSIQATTTTPSENIPTTTKTINQMITDIMKTSSTSKNGLTPTVSSISTSVGSSKCSSTVTAVAVPVAVISSLATGIITFLITCITMRKRDSKHSTASANIQLQSPGGGPVYDTPQWNIKQDNELHVETNKAYGQIKL